MSPLNRYDISTGRYRDAGQKAVSPPPVLPLEPESRDKRDTAPVSSISPAGMAPGADATIARQRVTVSRAEPDPFGLDLGLLGEMAEAAAADVQVTPAFALATALGVAALPVGLGASVQVREGWKEPAILQVAVIAAPSEGKTPLLDALMKPLYEAEGQLRDKRDAEIAEAEAKAAEPPNKPGSSVVPPRFLAFVGKGTAEALEHRAAKRGDRCARLALVTDEGGGALGDMGRYQASTNYDLLVSGYDAKRYSSERLSRDSVNVDGLRVPVLLMMQPSVWEALRGDPNAAGRGVLARFSPVQPESLVGTRDDLGTPIPARIAERWKERLSPLLKAAYEPGPHVMTLSAEALDVFRAARADNERELGTVREDEIWSAWKGKLPGRMVRIAAVLHALNTGSLSGEISADEMRTAVALGRWLEWHAERELSAALSPDARRLLAWAERRAEPAEPFSLRDAYRHLHWNANRAQIAARELVEGGLLTKAGDVYALSDRGARDTVTRCRAIVASPDEGRFPGERPDMDSVSRLSRDSDPAPSARPPVHTGDPDPEPLDNSWSEDEDAPPPSDEDAPPPDHAADARDLSYDVIPAPLGEPENARSEQQPDELEVF